VSAGGHRKQLKTSSAGTASLAVGAGNVTATATAPGYAKASVTFTVASSA
jgi:hypothetical protein